MKCPIKDCPVHGFKDAEQLADHFLFDHSNQQVAITLARKIIHTKQ